MATDPVMFNQAYNQDSPEELDYNESSSDSEQNHEQNHDTKQNHEQNHEQNHDTEQNHEENGEFLLKEKENSLYDVISYFFGERNGKEPLLTEDINYTLEALTYMAPRSRADEITKTIVTHLENQSSPSPDNDNKNINKQTYTLYECGGGIGGNTLSFLSCDKFNKVISYESNRDRYVMLRNNIGAYSLQHKAEVRRGNFLNINNNINPELLYQSIPEPERSVIFFDPPWLPPDKKGPESTRDDYIREGITIGGITLENWMVQLCNIGCPLVIFRLPFNYSFKLIAGFTIEAVPIKKCLLVICHRSSDSDSSDEEDPIKKEDFTNKHFLIPRAPNIIPTFSTSAGLSNSECNTRSHSYAPNYRSQNSYNNGYYSSDYVVYPHFRSNVHPNSHPNFHANPTSNPTPTSNPNPSPSPNPYHNHNSNTHFNSYPYQYSNTRGYSNGFERNRLRDPMSIQSVNNEKQENTERISWNNGRWNDKDERSITQNNFEQPESETKIRASYDVKKDGSRPQTFERLPSIQNKEDQNQNEKVNPRKYYAQISPPPGFPPKPNFGPSRPVV